MRLQKYSLYFIFIEELALQIGDLIPTQIGKIIVGASLVLAILTFLLSLTKKETNLRDNYSQRFLFISFVLGLMSLLSIAKTITNDADPWLDYFGNRYITLFFNPNCTAFVLAPLFILGYNLVNKDYVRLSFLLLIISIITFKGFVLLCAIPFILYYEGHGLFSKKVLLAIVILSIVESLINALVPSESDAGGGTTRSYLFVVAIAIGAILYQLFFKRNRKILYIYMLFVFGFLALSVYSGIHGDSVVETIMDFIGNENQDVDSSDTRTFLYIEVFEDLINNNAVLFGKGAYSHFMSTYFATSTSGEGDFYMRIVSEVYGLNVILKCGLIYFILLVALYIKGIYNAIRHGQSVFMRTIAIILTGWLVFGFITSTGTVNAADISMYIFLGMCHSRFWLSKTDKEIKIFLNTKTSVRRRNNRRLYESSLTH